MGEPETAGGETVRGETVRGETVRGEASDRGSSEPRSDGTRQAARGSRSRRALVTTLVALGLLFGVVGNVSGWGWWFLFDTGNFVGVVAPLSESDEVSRVLATRLVDQVVEEFDVEDAIADALPERAAFLAGPITTGASGFATDAVQTLIESDVFQQVWRRAIERAHEVALGILRDEGDVLRTTDGRVVLDLSGAATVVADALASVGLDLFDPADVPDDFGKFVLLENDQLATAQTAVRVLDFASFWLPIVALAMWGAAIALSRNRRRTTAVIGIAIAIAMLTELAMLRVARNSLLDNIREDDVRRATEIVWSELTDRLVAGAWAVLVFGLVVAGLAYVFGDASRAVRIRSGVTDRLHSYRGVREPGAEPDLLERVVRPYRRVFEALTFALALLYLLSVDAVRVRDVLFTAIVLLGVLAFIEFAAGPRTGDEESEPPELRERDEVDA